MPSFVRLASRLSAQPQPQRAHNPRDVLCVLRGRPPCASCVLHPVLYVLRPGLPLLRSHVCALAERQVGDSSSGSQTRSPEPPEEAQDRAVDQWRVATRCFDRKMALHLRIPRKARVASPTVCNPVGAHNVKHAHTRPPNTRRQSCSARPMAGLDPRLVSRDVLLAFRARACAHDTSQFRVGGVRGRARPRASARQAFSRSRGEAMSFITLLASGGGACWRAGQLAGRERTHPRGRGAWRP